jgi:hypothetical protein
MIFRNYFLKGEKMISVEDEVNKHKNCKERDKLERLIQEYKSFALQHAKNFVVAGQYNMVAKKLQEIYDRLPAQHIKNPAAKTQNVQIKTANITNAENAKINAAWKQKAGNTHDGVKR